MPSKRVTGFQKILSINSDASKYGAVIIKLHRVSQERRYDFEKDEMNLFLAFVHMLEHDQVFYHSSGLFTSTKENSRPINPTPRP